MEIDFFVVAFGRGKQKLRYQVGFCLAYSGFLLSPASLRQILGPHWDHLKPCDDKRLGFVIARWQALPEHVRNAIASLAEL